MQSFDAVPLPVHLNPVLKHLRPSATLAINERCAELIRQGRTIYRLGFGQSPFPVPPSVVSALSDNADQRSYLPVKGLAELRSAVADFHQRRYGINAEREDILIGPGSKELIFLAQFVYHAELILPSPSWVSYEPQAQLLGLPASWINTHKHDGWRLLPAELDRHCQQPTSKTRLLVLNYPNNPVGNTYSAEALEELAAVARRHELLIVSDEIYGEANHEGEHISIARFYPEGTIVSSGLSKWCGAGGWRLGTFCFPRELRWLLDAMASVASETFSAVAAPIQYAAVRAYQTDDAIEHYLSQSRRLLRALSRTIADRLQEIGIDTATPEGGFYLFPDFTNYARQLQDRGINSSAKLCEQLLLDTGVALLPGSDFGRPEEELTCRLAYVDFDGAACLNAMEALSAEDEVNEIFLRAHCNKVMTAINLLCEWVR